MAPQNGIKIPVDLKSLLSKWKLECILSHLLAEKIDTDVLEMMKLSHIRLLLQNFPLGIQIRFEYYLEQWREGIGKPFQVAMIENRLEFMAKEEDPKTKITAKETETKSTQTDLIIYNISSISPPNIESNKEVSGNSISSAENQISLELLPEQLPSKLPSTPEAVEPAHQVDLLTILKNASCGISLITSYGLRQSFSNAERTLLIDTVVNHYIKNNIKFSLKISYALEQAILKMFPSEKLDSYRTAKCSKIFISYIKAKAKAAKQEKENYESSKTMVVDDFEELYQLSDDHIVIQTNNTLESLMTDETDMSDNTESMIFTVDHCDDDDDDVDDGNKSDTKIDSGEVEIATTLDSAKLICKMLSQKRQRIEEIDRPFINFNIPWDKVPQDIMYSLEICEPLGRRLNIFSNLIVEELRKISTHVPMRVLRAVSQQAVMKYPHSFLDKDSAGNIKPSTTTALLSRLRNRNTFLNRQDR